MDFMKLIGTVLAVCSQPCWTLKGFASQRICRRGTEKPCYKISHHQNSWLRVGFEEARQTCRDEDGELLSIETENEQILMEKFIQDLQGADGDFWIGLQRNQDSDAKDCSSQYYWLDHSQATFRNWLRDEPSCRSEHCVALHHKPTTQRHYMFKWNDVKCNTRNNFICKYSEEKSPVPTPAGNTTALTDILKITLKPKQQPVTVDYEKIKTGFSESVPFSDDTINVYYILLATVPVLLLLILVVSGIFCYRVMARKKKDQNEIYAVPGQWLSAEALRNCNNHVPTNSLNQHGAHLEYMSSEISRTFIVPGPSSCCGDYENVQSSTAGFVTNDIYETSRSPPTVEVGWVDNDIYGY